MNEEPSYQTTLAGIAWGLLAVAIWSGSLVLMRVGIKTTLNAYDIAALRFGFAAVILLSTIWKEGFAIERLRWWGLSIFVLGQGAPYAVLVGLGLKFVPASQAAALLPGPMSAIAAVFGAVILHERLSARRWLGVGAILLGSLLIAGLAGGPVQHFGHVALLIAAVLWAFYIVVFRRTRLSALHATAIVAVGSAISYLPIYVAFLPSELGSAPLTDIVTQSLYQGGLTTVVGLLAFNRAVALLGASAGAALPALVPVLTLVMAAVLLNEIPEPSGVFAACFIAIGVFLVSSTPSSTGRGMFS